MRRDIQIISPDDIARRLEFRPNPSVHRIGRRRERENFESTQNQADARFEPRGFFLVGAVTQFGGDDNTRTYVLCADFADAPRYLSGGITNQVGYDVRVQEITHQSENGSGGGSSILGNSSSMGSKVANNSSNDGIGAGSMIRRSPSLRMIASSPGSS